MKINDKLIAVSIFIFSILVGVVAMYFFYIKIDDLLAGYFIKNLQSIGQARAEQVKLFLEGKQNRAVDFSSDGFIKDSLYDIKHDQNKEETMKKLSRHLILNKLLVDKDFYKVFTLGINGMIVASTDNESIGLDLAGDPIFLEGRNRPYIKSLSYDNISNVRSLILSAPVIKENEFVGVIAIKMLPDALTDMVWRDDDFGETFETYIINEKGYLITPSRFLGGDNRGILTQIVDTENSRRCLRNVADIKFIGEEHKFIEEEPVFFTDYRGEDVAGIHYIVPEMNWCLLAEIDYSEIWEGKKEGFKIAAVILLIGASVAALASFFIIRWKDD